MDFSPIILALALSGTFAEWDQTVCDRARFPSDDVLNNWMRFNQARWVYIEAKKKEIRSKGLYWDPRLTDEEFQWLENLNRHQGECERLYQICFYIATYPNQHPPAPWELKAWMDSARKRMTEQEWVTGYIPWGAVPPE